MWGFAALRWLALTMVVAMTMAGWSCKADDTPSNGDAGSIVSIEEGPLHGPEGVFVDRSGNLYTIDWPSCDVVILSSGGTSVRHGTDICGSDAAPTGIAVDSHGTIYLNSGCGVIVLDGTNKRSLPGSEGCTGSERSNQFLGITVDSHDNVYFVSKGCTVKKFDGESTTTVAGGTCGMGGATVPATQAIVYPEGIAVDEAGDLYIADSSSCTVRKVSSGTMTTVAGTGICTFHPAQGGGALTTELSYPGGIAVASDGSIYIAEGPRVRRISGGRIETVAGNGDGGYSGDRGPADQAALFARFGLALDVQGHLYFGEFLNCVIRRVGEGSISTILGTPCDSTSAASLPTSVPTTTPTGPCSHVDASLIDSLPAGRVYRAGESLTASIQYSAAGCASAQVLIVGHYVAGSPYYRSLCPQCIRPYYNGSIDGPTFDLRAIEGRLTIDTDEFNPPPDVDGLQVCAVVVVFKEGRSEGNSVTQRLPVECGDLDE